MIEIGRENEDARKKIKKISFGQPGIQEEENKKSDADVYDRLRDGQLGIEDERGASKRQEENGNLPDAFWKKSRYKRCGQKGEEHEKREHIFEKSIEINIGCDMKDISERREERAMEIYGCESICIEFRLDRQQPVIGVAIGKRIVSRYYEKCEGKIQKE